MPDPYRLTTDPEPAPERPSAPAPGARLRTAAWLVLALVTVGNSIASSAGGALAVHLVLGLVGAVCVGVLIAQRLRSGAETGR